MILHAARVGKAEPKFDLFRCSRMAYFLLASSIFFVYLAGSFLKSFRQSLQQSLISWLPLVNTYGLPMLSSFSPETTQVLSGYGLTCFGLSAAKAAAGPNAMCGLAVASVSCVFIFVLGCWF